LTKTDRDDLPIEEWAPHLDLFDPEHSRRSLEVLAYARDHCTLLRTEADAGYYIAARYEDVRAMTAAPNVFSSIEAGLRGTPVPLPPLTVDPPEHTEYRHQLNPYLSRGFLQRYEGDIRDIAVELLEKVVGSGRMEFMSDFAVPLTAQALAKVILDDDDQDRIARGAEATRRIAVDNSPEAFFEMAKVAEELLRARAEGGSGRDDVLSAIARTTIGGRPITMQEQVGFTSVLMSGGLDTTKGAMGNIVLRMVANPAIEPRLRDPDWIKRDLDEFLRLDSPVQFMARTVTTEATLGGCPLQPGDRIAIHFASANRDQRQFEKPDELVLDRAANRHVAFGLGPHRCIGMHFARLQLSVAFRELLNRATNFRIPEGEQAPISTGVVLAPERLPLEFDIL
jgi:cytochrome P450